MGQYQDFGVGINLHNNDLRDVRLQNAATEAAAITALDAGKGSSPHKGKVVYFDQNGGRIMYQGTGEKHILATMADVGSATLAGLEDTTITSAATGNLLRYNVDTWENLAVGDNAQYLRSNGTLPVWATIVVTEATMGTNTMLGRISAGTGVVQELNAAQVKTFLDIDNVVYDNDTITLSGDVTGTGDVDGGITTEYAGQLPYNLGGTTLTSFAQGDMLYASGTDALARLAKNTFANRYLANSGTNNNPAWQQIDYSHLANTPSEFTPEAHGLVSDKHTVSGLTTGHFLKATGATSFGFAAHGLDTDDITEAGNLYFTGARAIASVLTDFNVSSGATFNALAHTGTRDTIFQAFTKIQETLYYLDDKIATGTTPLEPADAIFENPSAALSGGGDIDGVTPENGSRVLVLDSSTSGQIGNVYVYNGSSWSVADEPMSGARIWIRTGVEYGGTTWVYDGTDWVQTGGAVGYTATAPIEIVNNDIRLADVEQWTVIGNPTNEEAMPSTISTTTEHHVLRVSGASLGFGFISGSNFASHGSGNLNKVFASPPDEAGKPSFRDLVWQDLPPDIPLANLDNATENHVVVTNVTTGAIETAATLNVARGGTGRPTLTNHAILLGNATGAVEYVEAKAANYWLSSKGANSDPDWASWVLPSTAAVGDLGKYLKISAANTSAWGDIEVDDLPATTTKTYVQALPSAGHNTTVMKGTHNFDGENDYIVNVELWQKEGAEFRKYNVDFVVDRPAGGSSDDNWNRVTAKASGSDWQWTADSYLVVTGVTK